MQLFFSEQNQGKIVRSYAKHPVMVLMNGQTKDRQPHPLQS
jgi:hypothetical protein